MRGTIAPELVAGTRIHLFARTVSLLLIVAAVTATTPALAEDKQPRKVHVLEQRPFLHALRVEVAPHFGYTVNEVMYQYLQVAGTLRFHINEEWSVGGAYGHYFSDTTSTFEQVQDEFQLFPEKSFLQWFGGGEAIYSPIYGKAILFGSAIINWNAYFTVGAGVTKTAAENLRITGTLGLGARVFLTQWMTFNLELKDHIYEEPFKNDRKELINNVVLFTGIGFFIPFTTEYKFPK